MTIEKLTRNNLLKVIHFDESIFGIRRLKYQKLSSMLDNQYYSCYTAIESNQIIGYLIYFSGNKHVIELVADVNSKEYKNIVTKLLKKNNQPNFQIEVLEENLVLQTLLRDNFNLVAIPSSIKNGVKVMTRKNKNGKNYYLMGSVKENEV